MKDLNNILNWAELGKYFANIDSKQQADFFKGMCHEMTLWGNHTDAESQLAFVNLELTPEERKTLTMLGVET